MLSSALTCGSDVMQAREWLAILPEAVEYAPYHQLRILNSAKNLKMTKFKSIK